MTGGLNGPPVTSGGAYAYPSRTLAQLVTELLGRMGFVTQMTSLPTRTLALLRQDCFDALGWPDVLNSAQTRTLAQVRLDVFGRMGYAALASYPPGMSVLLDSFINDAQAKLFRRLELDNGGVAFPAVMTSDGDTLTVDWVPVTNLALGMAKAHYGRSDAKVYFDMVEQYLADYSRRRPPNAADVVNSTLREAQEIVYRKYEQAVTVWALSAFTDDAHSTTIDYRPVLAQAIAMLKAKYGQKDADVYFAEVKQYYADRERRLPANATSVATKCLIDAQEQLFLQYPMLRKAQWFSWDITAGSRFYDVPKDGTLALDFRKINWVGYALADDTDWRMLTRGINPLKYSEPGGGYPTNYELGRYLELWPTPQSDLTIWLHGEPATATFASDSDVCTVDHEAVLLKALESALLVKSLRESYDPQGAGKARSDLQSYIGLQKAAEHRLRRYIPNDCRGAAGGPSGVDIGNGVRTLDPTGVRTIE
jgi:hypothetical protein